MPAEPLAFELASQARQASSSAAGYAGTPRRRARPELRGEADTRGRRRIGAIGEEMHQVQEARNILLEII